jgi:DNA-binding NarL/FixJ family response regulator
VSVIERDRDGASASAAPRELVWTATLLDGQPLWLDALAALLARHQVAAVAATTKPSDCIRDVEALQPDAVVLEPWLDGAAPSGVDLIARLRGYFPELRIVCLSSTGRLAAIEAAFAAGATAYLLKTAQPADVAEAVKHVCSEVMFFAPSSGVSASAAAGDGEHDGLEVLTPREREILRMVAEGATNAEVGRRLWVTEQTVKFHLSNTYRKIGVSNRTEAGRWAHVHGLVAATAG